MTNTNVKIIGGAIAIILLVGIGVYFLFFDQGTQETITINGAGSSFVYPIMSVWAEKYPSITTSNVAINYASIGSGGGIQQLREKTIDFAASDAPLNHEEFTEFKNALHIPVIVGGVVLAYNIPGVGDGLKLTGDIVAKIYLGEITSWDDNAIVALNPNVNMPSKPINVVHRSDGSGTTFVFTDYLSAVSTDWKTQVGKGKSVDWVVGIGAKGNEGVTAQIQQTEYSIGYIELSYAEINNLNTVALGNKAGEFVQASTTTIQKAVENAAALLPNGEKSWENVTLVNPPGQGAYPISSFVYIIVYQDLNNIKTAEIATQLKEFLTYIIHEGQAFAENLHYVPLADSVIKINERTLGLLTYQGITI